jgi:polyphosphate glucokinase
MGIDIGGSGIKGARVDLTRGELISDRIKYPTPDGGHPGDVLDVVKQILADLSVVTNDPIGVCFPAVVTNGVTRSAANVSADWIDLPAAAMFAESLGREVQFVNDADAAGMAEATFGAAKDVPGLVIMLTLGTGIGSAFLMDGVLIPNTELGHLEWEGTDAEKRTSNAAREREGLDFPTWAGRLTRYLKHLERIFSPNLFILGGGISAQAEEFFPLLEITTDLAPARLLNNAGIVGAAYGAAHTSQV